MDESRALLATLGPVQQGQAAECDCNIFGQVQRRLPVVPYRSAAETISSASARPMPSARTVSAYCDAAR